MPEIIKLNVKDRKILSELIKDPRNSMSKIGRTIGLSKEVVRYRIERLVSSGLIKSISPIINNFALNVEIFRLLINLHNFREGSRTEIVKELNSESNISVRVLIESRYDLEILMYVSKPSEFYDFYEGFLKKYGSLILNKDLSIISRQWYLHHNYLLEENPSVIIGEKKIIPISKNSEKILSILRKDARASVLDIANELKISSSSVIYSIKQLKQFKIIAGYRLVLNLSLLGYNKWKVGVSLSDLAHKEEIINYLAKQKSVSKITEFIGDMDFDFEVVFQTLAELDSFIQSLRTAHPYIRDYEVTNVLEI